MSGTARQWVGRALKPSALSLLIFFTIILPGNIVLSPISMTVSFDGATTWDVPWLFLAGSLAGGYLAAQLLAVLFRRATGFRRPARAYLLAMLPVVLLAFSLGIGFSKFYWGYYLFRPALLKEFRQIAQVAALVPVETSDATNAPPTLVHCGDFSLAEDLAYAVKNSYDDPVGRLLLALEQQRLLPAEFSASLSGLPPLLPLAQTSGLIAPSEDGYDSERSLRGIVVDAVDPAGARLVYLGLRGGQVSNDHYPYYELLFTAPAGSSDLKFVRGQRFFFDVAGIEGAEWYVMGLGFSLVAIPLALVALMAAMALGRAIAWLLDKRKTQKPPL